MAEVFRMHMYILCSSMPQANDFRPAPRLDREHDHARGRDGKARRRDEQRQRDVDREHEPSKDRGDDASEPGEGGRDAACCPSVRWVSALGQGARRKDEPYCGGEGFGSI